MALNSVLIRSTPSELESCKVRLIHVLLIAYIYVILSECRKSLLVNNDSDFEMIDTRFMVGIQVFTNNMPNFTCSGFFVDIKWVVTSAHCLLNNVTYVKVFFGSLELKNCYSIESKYWMIYPEYDNVSDHNDIALIKVRIPLDLRNSVDILEVEKENWSKRLPFEKIVKKCLLIGFGSSDETGDRKLHLREYTISANNMKCSCVQKTIDIFCIFNDIDNDDALCYGDSGAPLICGRNAVGLATSSTKCIGNTSEANFCGKNMTNIFINLHYFQRWIRKQYYLRIIEHWGHNRNGDCYRFTEPKYSTVVSSVIFTFLHYRIHT
ncbi:hypothetical protein O3M35_003047 [Rhynocoris fuscipes]|uniref:Peptidase S1 domain-containing protein n=1 Tax=Rhynocoris fuscipes TaxID=488301 RepID=A0AAW1CIZ2_9HEMI